MQIIFGAIFLRGQVPRVSVDQVLELCVLLLCDASSNQAAFIVVLLV